MSEFVPDLHASTRVYLLSIAPLALGLGRVLKASALPNRFIAPVLLALGLALGIGHGISMGAGPWDSFESALLGMGAAALAVAGYETSKARGGGPRSGGSSAPGSGPPPLPPPPVSPGGTLRLALLASVVALVGCTPSQAATAHAASDVGEVACRALVTALAPGLEGLCGLADDALDAAIDAETRASPRAATAPGTAPPSRLRVALAVREFRAANRRK